MGIRMLNRFLREKASNCIQLLPMAMYTNKRIVVDASIYMYRYIGDNSLIENYYLMCLLFRHYNISALFVFDGQPPKEKSNELKERASLKKKAKKELSALETQLNNSGENEKKELLSMKKNLMKQCIHVKAWHLSDVKNLIDATGHQWLTAPGEADHLCAKLVREGYADACMSEDMDMFVHGCPRVLRYMSLNKENFVEYNLPKILKTLKISFQEFQELCILAGTDYNKWMELNNLPESEESEESKKKNIFQFYQDILSYQRDRNRCSPIQQKDINQFEPIIDFGESLSETSFFAWCLDTGLIDSEKYTQLEHIQSFFESENYPELNQECYKPIIKKKEMDQGTIRKVLSYHHFY